MERPEVSITFFLYHCSLYHCLAYMVSELQGFFCHFMVEKEVLGPLNHPGSSPMYFFFTLKSFC